MSADFRKILANETRADHDQLDRLFSSLNIAHPIGFAYFINIHLICFQAMYERSPRGGRSDHLLFEMIKCLEQDCSMICGTYIGAAPSLPSVIDPLAIDYIVAGSRLGTKVLYKRWAASTDQTVHAANNYFGLESDARFWRATCEALSDIPLKSARTQTIIRDARTLFELFAAVYNNSVAQEVTVQ